MTLETISPISFESVSNVTTDPSVELGMRRSDASGNEYVYVYNLSNVEVPPGRCVYLPTASSGYSVTVTNTASQIGNFAGGVHHATLVTGGYGWIMTKGVCRVAPDTNAASFNTDVRITVGVDDGYVPFVMTVTSGAADGHLFSDYEGAVGWTISSGVTQTGTLTSTLGEARIASRWL